MGKVSGGVVLVKVYGAGMCGRCMGHGLWG